MKKMLYYGLCACVLLLNACQGDKGAVGPQGPQGLQGPQGAKGDKGASGDFPKVLTGSQTIRSGSWLLNTDDIEFTSYYTTISTSQITKDVLDKGMVQVYYTITQGTTTASYALPYTVGASFRMLQMAYTSRNEGFIRIDLLPAAGATIAARPSADITVRWVITTAN